LSIQLGLHPGEGYCAVLESLLRTVAVTTSVLVLLGWALFGIDETRSASDLSQREIAGQVAVRSADPTPAQERAREDLHSTAREAIDDANDILMAPFAGLVEGTTSQWVRRTVPALLGLLIYGFGVGYLARYTRGRA
jgi:hypothetical protein